MEAMNERLFYFLPFLDQNKWLLLFPKRQKAHQNLAKFFDMLSNIIETKRELISGGNIKSSYTEEEKQETDLLSLMIESKITDGKAGLTDEEIRVCIE
jgi:cytochrome P450